MINNVGGIKHELKTSNQDGPVFTYVTKREQQDALDFIGKQVIETPMWLIPEEIISMVGYQGSVDKLHAYQYDMLESILSDRRMYRLSEAEVYGADVLSVSEVITQVIDKVFDGDADRPRRQLQRQLVELLLSKIDEEASDLVKTSELPAIYRLQVERLVSALANKSASSEDLIRAHYDDLASRITRATQ